MATRNRYAEIMAQYAQTQPYSFFGYPQSYTGGQSGYTGGFDTTPYTPYVAPANRYADIIAQGAATGGGGGRGEREPEDPNSFSAQWAAMNDAEREAFRLENPNTAIAQDAVMLFASPLKFLYDKAQEYMGPDSSTGGPARYTPAAPNATPSEKAKQANPMSVDPSQRVVSAPVVTAPPVVAPAPAPVAPEPVQMETRIERWNGEDAPEGGGWSRVNLGRGQVEYQRTVSVPVSGGGASGGGIGGYTVGGYAPGSQAAAAAASGQFGMGPGTPGFNTGMSGLYKGGHVSMQHLQGPDPDGPDDGYAALKMGEYVINDKAVKKYGIELMNAINSGKISKGKLRGLLEM